MDAPAPDCLLLQPRLVGQPKVGLCAAGLLVQPGGCDGISDPSWHQVAVRAVMGPVVKVPAAAPHRVLRTDHQRSFRGLAMAIREQNVNPVIVAVGRPLAVAGAVIRGVDIRITAWRV